MTSSLERTLKPTSVAVVGLSDTSRFAEYIEPTLDSEAEVFFVHHKNPTVFGRPAVKSLSELDRPIDVVLSTLNAERSTDLAEQAAELDVGGLVLIAGGFAETGEAGRLLQDRLANPARRGNLGRGGPHGPGHHNPP